MLNNQQALKLSINKFKKVHFIGITGSFNSFCASYLINKGIKVTASEINQDNLQGKYWRDKGVLYKGDHNEKYVTKDLDLIIYPNGPIPGNVECEKAEELKIPALTIGQLTGLVSLNFNTIAVAGTHGKTTTTSLITWMLHKTKETPNFIVGDAEDKIAKLNKNWNYNKKSKYLVLEACEYKKQFIQRAPNPYIAVITNIDLDHTDFYKSQKDYNKAFIEFINNSEYVVISSEGKNEQDVLKKVEKKVNVCDLKNFKVKRIESNLPGTHNQQNLLRAYAVGNLLKIKENKLLEAFKTFPGITKRFEYVKKTRKGSLIYKDYAHNPAKIKAVIQGAKEKYYNKKLVLVWQPHSYERTNSFKKDFAKAIKNADIVIIPNIFAPRRESEDYKKLITVSEFVEYLKLYNKDKEIINTKGIENIQSIIKNIDNGNCVFIFASAGDLHNKIKNLIN